MMRLIIPALALMMTVPASAQEPPIKSAQDAACREEARANLFGAPNPQGLGLYQLGTQLYYACMNRTQRQNTPRRSRSSRPQ